MQVLGFLPCSVDTFLRAPLLDASRARSGCRQARVSVADSMAGEGSWEKRTVVASQVRFLARRTGSSGLFLFRQRFPIGPDLLFPLDSTTTASRRLLLGAVFRFPFSLLSRDGVNRRSDRTLPRGSGSSTSSCDDRGDVRSRRGGRVGRVGLFVAEERGPSDAEVASSCADRPGRRQGGQKDLSRSRLRSCCSRRGRRGRVRGGVLIRSEEAVVVGLGGAAAAGDRDVASSSAAKATAAVHAVIAVLCRRCMRARVRSLALFCCRR